MRRSSRTRSGPAKNPAEVPEGSAQRPRPRRSSAVQDPPLTAPRIQRENPTPSGRMQRAAIRSARPVQEGDIGHIARFPVIGQGPEQGVPQQVPSCPDQEEREKRTWQRQLRPPRPPVRVFGAVYQAVPRSKEGQQHEDGGQETLRLEEPSGQRGQGPQATMPRWRAREIPTAAPPEERPDVDHHREPVVPHERAHGKKRDGEERGQGPGPGAPPTEGPGQQGG